jgi:hypothetical protein
VRVILLALFLLAAIGCAKKPQTSTPAPPSVATKSAKPAPPKQLTAGPKDLVVHGCIVMKEGKKGADCMCRHASTTIDSETGAHSLECRSTAGPK